MEKVQKDKPKFGTRKEKKLAANHWPICGLYHTYYTQKENLKLLSHKSFV